DVDPSLARRMFRLACDIGGVIDAVEVDRLAEVVLPTAMGRRGKACHLGGRRPYAHVPHHFVVTHAGRNPTGAPHDAGHSETALERRALFTAERHRASVRPRILPRAIVGGDDDDSVGSLGADGIHDLANV